MTRSPHRTRPGRDDDDQEERPSQQVARLSDLIDQHLILPKGPPGTDEEDRRTFYAAMVRLRAQGKTFAECALLLNTSERSLRTYVKEPLYAEVHSSLIDESKQRGHLLLSEMTDEAFATMYGLMKNARSDFVQFKAAEAILNYAGYNVPREQQQQDSREGVLKFLAEVEARRQPNVIVNVGAPGTLNAEAQPVIIEADQGSGPHANIPQELAQYYEPVLPGGKLPAGFKREDRERKEEQQAGEEDEHV